MSSTYGDNLKLSIFGQSHGAAIGMVLDGIPAGLPVDLVKLQEFMNRRAPGQSALSSQRKEADKPEILSGIVDNFTCGAPIAAVIQNRDSQAGDYDDLKNTPRPGHADYTAHVKYGGYQDAAGGGHFSGRLTASLCIAGGLCKLWLEEIGIRIGAHIARIGNIDDSPLDPIHPQFAQIGQDFPVLDPVRGSLMREQIATAKNGGDSIGGIIECGVTGVPAGLGEPIFGGVESKIAQIIYAIPGVKGVDFGLGFGSANYPGSFCNDEFAIQSGEVVMKTNHSGGILGGITSGMPILFRAAVKPTPSIAKPQQTVNLQTCEETVISVKGRHDPCIVPRAVPVVEAAAAIAIYDLILGNTQTERRK